jgi:hypothetical protein
MITGTFTCESGTVTIEIDAGTATATLLSVGSIKYTFDITPDAVVIDRLMAVYQRLDCTMSLYSVEGDDLYDLLSVIVGKADVTVTVTRWTGEVEVFPFVLEAKDVSLDERSQVLKTSFGVFADTSVTVGDVWDEIVTNHSGDIFDFLISGDTYDAVGARLWIETAMELIFGLAATDFQSYPIATAGYMPNVYSYVDPTVGTDDGKRCYVCINTAGLSTNTGVLADDLKAVNVLQSMAGHEGGVFGSGFSEMFYSNRSVGTMTPISITYDDVLELGFAKNFQSFTQIQTGVIENFFTFLGYDLPNLTTQDVSPVQTLNANAEKSVNIQLNAGFPVMCVGVIDQSNLRVNAGNSTAIDGMIQEALGSAQVSYKLALPADGALKINATLYGWGKVKPWEAITFDSTCPTRYQSKTFRINDVSYNLIQGTTTITAYQVS